MGGKSSKAFSKKDRKHRPLSLSSKSEMPSLEIKTEVIKKRTNESEGKTRKKDLFGGQE